MYASSCDPLLAFGTLNDGLCRPRLAQMLEFAGATQRLTTEATSLSMDEGYALSIGFVRIGNTSANRQSPARLALPLAPLSENFLRGSPPREQADIYQVDTMNTTLRCSTDRGAIDQ
jgi:hypothetical protein